MATNDGDEKENENEDENENENENRLKKLQIGQKSWFSHTIWTMRSLKGATMVHAR